MGETPFSPGPFPMAPGTIMVAVVLTRDRRLDFRCNQRMDRTDIVAFLRSAADDLARDAPGAGTPGGLILPG